MTAHDPTPRTPGLEDLERRLRTGAEFGETDDRLPIADSLLTEAADTIRALTAERDALRTRNEALEGLLACYRTGSRPSEKLFRQLEASRRAIEVLNPEGADR